ncbi:L,D-transpeptidase family protein [Inhella proteolytica]|uniref:L,D-transpeptidase family protein n=1 Tax=Inhella proteolytica TaxID=2795029 RepID=A0A931NG48_9BURK|nr:L,D-transpeptidase family protein [Inhella proteolytica]MBH9579512.1 L,D-transpeptidase family protein [Inhella proteolytica]
MNRRRSLCTLALLPLGAAASPWWQDDRPSPLAAQALALLNQADSHGLNPADYGLPALADAWLAAPDETARAALAETLQAALLRYLRHLRLGRVDPAALGLGFGAPREPFDPAAALQAALALQDLAAAERAAAPALPQYQRLRQALAQYRALAEHPAWAQSLPALPARQRLEPGQAWEGLPLLSARLLALGDLAPTAVAAERLEGDVLAALCRFQARHGLEADGVLGRATRAALEVPPARRLRQLVLALERLRWTPLRAAPRMLVINLPEYRLRAYELQGEGLALRAEMRVIVGQALDRRTPLLLESLRRIEFQPFWNVPYKIARDELVPELRRDPAQWAREGYEFVGPAGVEAELSEDRLAEVLRGRLRIRQRPGPRNALGAIKFVFPNRESVYLHHTPSTRLFARSRRDLSHGCIRVEDPAALAAFVLQGQPGWNLAAVRAALADPRPQAVAVAEPLPMLITYGTALVRGGEVCFFEDVYGLDPALEAALGLPKP